MSSCSDLLWLPSDVERTTVNRILAVTAISVHGCNESVAPKGKLLGCELKYCDTPCEHMVELFMRSKRLVLGSCSRTARTGSRVLCGFILLTMRRRCQSWSMDRHPSSKGTSRLTLRGATYSVCWFSYGLTVWKTVVELSRGQLDGPWKVDSFAFPGSLLRALRQELGGREGSLANTLLALLIREGGSTSEHREGLCAVVPVSHEYLGATASGCVGECANC